MLFHDIWLLLLLALIPLLIITRQRKQQTGNMQFPSLSILKIITAPRSVKARKVLILLRYLVIALIIVALARPQKGKEETRIPTEGIDIILAVDVSGSMQAEDFQLRGKRQNRLAVVKSVIKDFIMRRQNDRIGMVVFAGRPYTQCPLTIDYGWLLQQIERTQIGMVEDGTAIGSAIAASLNRLRQSEAKSKIIILLTDGRNNAGRISPETAAEAARALEVKIYTIGAGKKGLAPFPVKDFFGNTVYRGLPVEIDDEALENIADVTGGKYFRATDTKSLEEIYREIDKLEKTEIEITHYGDYRELAPFFLLPGLGLLLVEIFLSHTRLKRIP